MDPINNIKVEQKSKIIKVDKYQKAEMYLIYYMLQSSEVIELYEKNVGYIPTLKYRQLAKYILQFNKNNNRKYHKLIVNNRLS